MMFKCIELIYLSIKKRREKRKREKKKKEKRRKKKKESKEKWKKRKEKKRKELFVVNNPFDRANNTLNVSLAEK